VSNVNEKLAKSLTAETVDLIPHLPYLLQDLWELGSSPTDMVDLIATHVSNPTAIRVLDLACGKGAVSVRIAKAFGSKVKGIDLMKDFIDVAIRKATEEGVSDLCEFEVGDINDAVEVEKNYDIVVLGAVGDVLGNPSETLAKLKKTVKPDGFLLMDDAYYPEKGESDFPSRAQWMRLFESVGLVLLDERFNQEDELKRLNEEQQTAIKQRAIELMQQYPDQASLFESYIQSQQSECDELEGDLEGVTMMLRIRPSVEKENRKI